MLSTSSAFPFLLLLLVPSALSQTVLDGCIRLQGSVACPGFSQAWIQASNLSNAFPFFDGVTDVASFDAGALAYFSNPTEFRQTKFVNQLGCTNSSTAMIRYARTVLCSMWVNEHWSIACFDLYNASSIATGPKMVCQETCIQNAESESALVLDQTYCPGPDLTGGTRQGNLTKDFVQCTNWTSLATANSSTCVLGSVNEGNCGYGPSTVQLCSFCNASSPDSCCYASNTDLTTCGFTLPPQATTSSAAPSSTTSSSTTGGVSSQQSTGKGLSGGQIAGIVVGSVVGGLLLIALLIALLAFCGCLTIGSAARRRRERNTETGAISAPLVHDNNAANTPSTHHDPAMSEISGGGISGLGIGGAPSTNRTIVPGSGSSYSSGIDKLGKLGAAGGTAAAGVGGIAAGRSLLSHVRDENQSTEQLIMPNTRVTVLWPYSAALPDELTLRPGMKLTVLRIYDDGWATGIVIEGEDHERGKQGAYPTVCVTVDRTSTSPNPTGTGSGSPNTRRSDGESEGSH